MSFVALSPRSSFLSRWSPRATMMVIREETREKLELENVPFDENNISKDLVWVLFSFQQKLLEVKYVSVRVVRWTRCINYTWKRAKAIKPVNRSKVPPWTFTCTRSFSLSLWISSFSFLFQNGWRKNSLSLISFLIKPSFGHQSKDVISLFHNQFLLFMWQEPLFDSLSLLNFCFFSCIPIYHSTIGW